MTLRPPFEHLARNFDQESKVLNFGHNPQASWGTENGMATSAVDRSHALDHVHEIARVLGVKMKRETLTALVAMCEQGVDPQVLAEIVKLVRRNTKESA